MHCQRMYWQFVQKGIGELNLSIEQIGLVRKLRGHIEKNFLPWCDPVSAYCEDRLKHREKNSCNFPFIPIELFLKRVGFQAAGNAQPRIDPLAKESLTQKGWARAYWDKTRSIGFKQCTGKFLGVNAPYSVPWHSFSDYLEFSPNRHDPSIQPDMDRAAYLKCVIKKDVDAINFTLAILAILFHEFNIAYPNIGRLGTAFDVPLDDDEGGTDQS